VKRRAGRARHAPQPSPKECARADEALVRAFRLLGKRWTGVILGTLSSGPAGFRALARAVDGISDSVLADRLAELVEAGLITRAVAEGPPLGVTYALTEAGRALLPPWSGSRAGPRSTSPAEIDSGPWEGGSNGLDPCGSRKINRCGSSPAIPRHPASPEGPAAAPASPRRPPPDRTARAVTILGAELVRTLAAADELHADEADVPHAGRRR
jgi:DNA-binding HxlR family transcriptional regulator